jgi:hypothetical protein
MHIHHTNRVRPFHNRGRTAGLADVSICELAGLDCACLWFRFELTDSDQRKKNSI